MMLNFKNVYKPAGALVAGEKFRFVGGTHYILDEIIQADADVILKCHSFEMTRNGSRTEHEFKMNAMAKVREKA